MSIEDNKALARIWFEEVMNGRDLGAIDRAYSEGYTYSGPNGETARGREQSKAIATALHEAMPDRVASVEFQLAEGDYVVTRWVSRGTQRGPLLGRPATNEPVEVHGITITRVANGLIASDWEIIEVL